MIRSRTIIPVASLLVGSALVAGLSFTFASAQLDNAPAQSPANDLQRTVALARESASESQQPRLTDGVVTWDEHEAAILDVAACARSAGVSVVVNGARGKRPTTVGFTAPTLEQAEVARGQLDACKQQYLDAVDSVWLAQNRPSAEQEAAIERWLAECLTEQGVPAQATGVTKQMGDILANGTDAEKTAVVSCIAKKQETLGP